MSSPKTPRIFTPEEMTAAMERAAALDQEVDRAIATGDFSRLSSALGRSVLSWKLARNRDWARSEEVALSIQDNPEIRGETLGQLAQQLADFGDPVNAERVAHLVPTDLAFFSSLHEKCVALIRTADAFAKQGSFDGMQRVLGDAGTCIRVLDGEAAWEAADCWLLVALVYADIGWHSEAEGALQEAILSAGRREGEFECTKILAQATAELARVRSLR